MVRTFWCWRGALATVDPPSTEPRPPSTSKTTHNPLHTVQRNEQIMCMCAFNLHGSQKMQTSQFSTGIALNSWSVIVTLNSAGLCVGNKEHLKLFSSHTAHDMILIETCVTGQLWLEQRAEGNDGPATGGNGRADTSHALVWSRPLINSSCHT